MDRLGAAIIGCGNIHKVHAEAIKNSEYADLIAVVDIDEQKAKSSAELYDCRYYIDYKEMLKDKNISVVHICTPHYLHVPMAIEAIKAGKHVLTEKPVGMNVKEINEMVETADKYGKFVGAAFQNRFRDNSVKAKEILENGQLGDIKAIKAFVTWHRDGAYYTKSDWRGKYATEGGGVMINQAIHTIDLMQWLVGEVESIKGHIDTRVLEKVIEVEDTAEATLFYKNGAVGIFYATNCYSINSGVEIEIVCSDGILKINDDELILSKAGINTTLISNMKEQNSEKIYKSYWGNNHNKLIAQFYNCILSGKKAGYTSAKDGIPSIKIIEAIYKSSKENVRVNL